jgi:hypothetical protein
MFKIFVRYLKTATEKRLPTRAAQPVVSLSNHRNRLFDEP